MVHAHVRCGCGPICAGIRDRFTRRPALARPVRSPSSATLQYDTTARAFQSRGNRKLMPARWVRVLAGLTSGISSGQDLSRLSQSVLRAAFRTPLVKGRHIGCKMASPRHSRFRNSGRAFAPISRRDWPSCMIKRRPRASRRRTAPRCHSNESLMTSVTILLSERKEASSLRWSFRENPRVFLFGKTSTRY
jgi:hypothetical protein